MSISRRVFLTATGAAALAPAPLRAQPGRPIRFVVGFPPGGSGDLVARVLGEAVGRELGQTVVVDNRPGAGSNIATEYIARSEPDGTSLLIGGNFSHAVNPALYRRVPFNSVADFTPITEIADYPTIITVSPATGITSLRGLIERARAEPGRLAYATPGNGTPSHLAGAMLEKVAGIELTHVPFRGGAPALQAVLAGDVPLTIGTPPVVLPFIRSGQLRGLSLTTRRSFPIIPEVIGTEEAGLPELDIGGWWGMWGPARLPAPMVMRLFEATVRALGQQGVVAKLAGEGLQVVTSPSPEEFSAFIQREIPFWAEVVRAAGAVVE
ncbi:tripartite tricarboxylate transporter substrate binding protein [Belnapia rosea]|uniref:Tripartite-type tricarboxylate transporter, receptor component TctC n=1 Tax=Belnapia rosea TaxID=938405 RepID=A0A1G7CR72_9PROT|nr:tripartite tricarboxylate transporter substrate binding protein [Belnapia rosea]SDE41828.1 Tripartite-type tricarboxylate transporter, receptor component TctC [Belnapia rosea]